MLSRELNLWAPESIFIGERKAVRREIERNRGE
jgi:hypothetical protein